MRRTLSWGTLLSLLTASPMALALGLAAPRVESTLGAPLQARLPLTDIGELDPALIKARLATADAFAQAGIPRTSLVESVNATVSRGPGGLTVVLSTSQAVHEPYISLLLTLEWPGGQQRQEVNLLLDPPGYAQMPALQPGATRPLRQGEAVETVQSATPQATARRERAAPGQIRVSSGDTLWVLADRVRPDGVSIEHMMLALQQANPEAFPGGNINRLSAGATLEVPDRQAILASGENADQRVQAQNRQWQAQRGGEAGERVATAGAGDAATRPETAVAGEGSPEDGQSRLTLLNDTVLDATQAAGEPDTAPAALPVAARERLAALEAQLDDTRQTLAQANEQRDQLADQVGMLREEIQSLRAQLDGLLASRQSAARAQSEPTQSAQAQTAPAQRVQAGKPPAESFGQAAWRWFNDNLTLLAGAALALLLALWVVVRRRARRTEETTDPASRYTAMGGVGGAAPGRSEPSMAETSAIRQTPTERAPAAPVASSEPAPASALATGASLDSAPEAETISEAEIYLAYGRYDQARERLVQSLAVDPERHDLRLKLLTACVALGDHDAAEREAAYLDAHGDEQQRAEARETLARLMPDTSTARAPIPAASAAPAESPKPTATEATVPSSEAAPVVSAANAPGSGDPQPAHARAETHAEVQGEGEALSGLADAAVASGVDLDDGRVIDYQPPSLDIEPERREPELGQPVVEFPDDPLGLDYTLADIDDDHATLADADPVVRGESSSSTDTSGWIVEEVAFDPLDLDNERSTTHASPVGSAPANAAELLDHARQRLDRGEREAARELLDPLLEEEGTLVADEARVLIERHRL
ncbi:FimV/HubP family polar landmark protein [Halomonas sp. HP20-15]|uniref:type IV pilus assembly protein FimV n=1 Tax=Halomonas sp. HP20-15 TaxID=3085901 RepID=UPI00298229D6|nr:FimV/HubP family polar landmark protein [Halomonas sp. HP20-15]MDW5377095.1 FimV/HubP family polar landmark protein [Halomonas sp. HP20-15]